MSFSYKIHIENNHETHPPHCGTLNVETPLEGTFEEGEGFDVIFNANANRRCGWRVEGATSLSLDGGAYSRNSPFSEGRTTRHIDYPSNIDVKIRVQFTYWGFGTVVGGDGNLLYIADGNGKLMLGSVNEGRLLIDK